MNRSVICGVAALAVMVAVAMTSADNKAEAGLFGGRKGNCCEPAAPRQKLFQKKACGGGLFAKLKARKAACCEPAPVCCEPAPVCCEPAPVCCEPAPVTTCCEPAPVADCCGSTMTYSAPVMATSDCCGGSTMVMDGGMIMGSSVMGSSVMGETIISESPVASPVTDSSADEAADSEVPPTPET